jgi:site-specific DNA-methyltransferase (adenine-specific)
MGSGQTALAALQAGRRFVGYEVDESYVRLAEDRLHRAEGGMPLDANSPLQEK